MIPEILQEVLHFLDRDALDLLQLVASGLCSTIEDSESSLAVRSIGMVCVVS